MVKDFSIYIYMKDLYVSGCLIICDTLYRCSSGIVNDKGNSSFSALNYAILNLIKQNIVDSIISYY